jgi:hypothetical protein
LSRCCGGHPMLSAAAAGRLSQIVYGSIHGRHRGAESLPAASIIAIIAKAAERPSVRDVKRWWGNTNASQPLPAGLCAAAGPFDPLAGLHVSGHDI